MRVLLDENLPHDLIAALSEHEVLTVQGLGWAGVQNGELLRRANGLVDALITMDRKLERQQNLTGFKTYSRWAPMFLRRFAGSSRAGWSRLAANR